MLDVVLEASPVDQSDAIVTSFNPCCAGCSSGRSSNCLTHHQLRIVSILVVLDVVLEVGDPVKENQ